MNNIKHSKLLKVASIINLCLGVFLIICGILEFIGIIPSDANRIYRAVGIRLSVLVFISGILVFISAIATLAENDDYINIDFLIFLGVASLAWPIFVFISLFFATFPHTICIRLVPTILTSLFYVISVMIVKITNEALRKVHKFNLNALVNRGKKKSGINVANVLRSTGEKKAKQSHGLNSIGGIAAKFNSKNGVSIQRIFNAGGKRRSGGGGFFKRIYSGSRKRGKFRLHK